MANNCILNTQLIKAYQINSLPVINARIIDGKKIAEEIIVDLKSKIVHFSPKPKLAIILVGNDPASYIYVNIKIKKAFEVGILTQLTKLHLDTTTEVLLSIITRLNFDTSICGIILQLPLPCHVNSKKLFEAIAPEKDVDGLNPLNIGRLYSSFPIKDLGNIEANYEYTLHNHFIPCTALGILRIIREVTSSLSGLNIVIVNRSNLVGKPLAALLLQRNATVTICHSYSNNLQDITKSADIVICAIGKKHFFDKKYFKKDSIVIDVGINKSTTKKPFYIVGDVNFNNLLDHVSFITPVPGGVGPLTVAYLLSNTFWAASKLNFNL